VRLGRVTAGALLESLAAQGFQVRPSPYLPAAHGVYEVERAPFPLSETLEHWLGLFYIQQAATCLAAPFLNPQPGEAVLDLCAAPGGKTTHLAEWMGDRGSIVAVDSSESRLQALGGNASRLAHPGILSVVGDALALPEGVSYHRILADVPCSGEGRLRQMPGHRGASRGDLGRLPSLQEALLRKGLRMLAPGGRLLYVTCTLAPEENEAVLSQVLTEPRDGEPPIRLLPLEPDLPHAPGLTQFEGVRYHPDVAGACRIHPHHLNSGGLFLALLEHAGAAQEATAISARDRNGLDLVPAAPPELRGWGAAPSDGGPFSLAPSPLRWAGQYSPPRVHTLSGWPIGGWALDGSPVDPDSADVGEAGFEAAAGVRTQSRDARAGRGRKGQRGVTRQRADAGPRGSSVASPRRAPRLLRAGLRGVEEGGSPGASRPLPTPDLLRWISAASTAAPVLELNRGAWLQLLDGAQVDRHGDEAAARGGGSASEGGVLLSWDGVVLGTAAVRQGRLIHRLPEAKAQWLRQTMARRPDGVRLPAVEPQG
jgi:tRNA (cytosine49-C5)-methyltransferase